MFRRLTVIAATAACVLAAPALALDEEVRAEGEALRDKAVAWLKSQQDQATGGWSVSPEGSPQLPAISGLVLNGMLMPGGPGAEDPAVRRGLAFILSFAKPEGGIHDNVLPSYNTSICLSALSKLDSAEARRLIPKAQDFLRGLQWGEESSDHPSTGNVPREHPFYGGVGYGGSGRPDNSNLNIMLQALHDSGVPGDDPAFQRALVFLQRTQMLDAVNDMPYADGSTQGGFIYSTSPNRDSIGEGESKAGVIDETLVDGTRVSRLRSYGSMTYAGFKSYLYADLSPTDPRVAAAMDWISENYTLEENPGIGMDGFYYYLITFARALDAAGIDEIESERTVAGVYDDLDALDEPVVFRPTGGGEPMRLVEVEAAGEDGTVVLEGELAGGRIFEGLADGAGRGQITVIERRDWRADLIERMSELQNEDGSFRPVDDRWMEDNQVLITAYSLVALQHALQ